MIATLLALAALAGEPSRGNGDLAADSDADTQITDRAERYRQEESRRIAEYKQWRQEEARQDAVARRQRLRTRSNAPTRVAQENLASLQGQVILHAYRQMLYPSYFYSPQRFYQSPRYVHGRYYRRY
jgi:hypothetical protein